MPVAPAPSETELAERLAARTLELIDIPSRVPRRGGARRARGLRAARGRRRGRGSRATRACSRTRARRGRGCCSPGHLDTVPAQDNLPGRIDRTGACHGLGASDMKGALRGDDRARARAGAVRGAVLPARGAAVDRERARRRCWSARRCDARVRRRDGADRRRAARGLPRQHQRDVDVLAGAPGTPRGRGRPTTRSTRAALGIAALAAAPSVPVTLRRADVPRGGVGHARSSGGIAMNVIPETCVGARQLPLRAGPHAAGGRGAAAGADAAGSAS